VKVALADRLPWTKIKGTSDIQLELADRLPEGTPSSAIQAFAEEQGLECSEVEDGVIYCSAPASSPIPGAQAKWLLEFELDDGRLRRVRVRRGYIAA
jgi:hypothetical protein